MTNYQVPSSFSHPPDFSRNFDISGNNWTSGTKYTIYDLEKNLIVAINNFYVAYAEYIRCGSKTDADGSGDTEYKLSNYYDNDIIKTPVGCSATKPTKSSVDDLQVIVKNKANSLKRALSSTNGTSGSIDTDLSSFNTAHNDILNKYSDNLNLRNELDLKMKEILKTDDSFVNQSKLHYDSTMYASIGWTILATSLLYYVFRKL